MNVLITRPAPRALHTINKIVEAGFSVISEPCQMVNRVEAVLQAAEAYIVTSQNGVEHGLKYITDKDAVIFAVGEKTALAAQGLGFEIIFAADGDSESLIEVILSRWQTDFGSMIHLSGQTISSDISALLNSIGYAASRSIVYKAQTIEIPSSKTLQSIKSGNIDAVLFYSAQAVTIFNQWIAEASLENSLKTMNAIVMSKRIAEQLDDTWKSIKIAKSKDEDELINILQKGG